MATIRVQATVLASGGTPFTASELAEVTAYVNHNVSEFARNYGSADFRLTYATDSELTYSFEGEFL